MGDVSVPPRVPSSREAEYRDHHRGQQALAHAHTDELAHISEQLLDALRRLRAAEQGLRDQTISSEEFRRLADAVDVLRDGLAALRR